MFVTRVQSMLIQSQANEAGIGSKSRYLYGVNLMILRILSSDMIPLGPETGGSASVDINPDIN